MRAALTRACALLALGLVLVAAACGGLSATGTAASKGRADAHWRGGLVAWRREMLRALNGISLLVATQVSLADLLAPHSRQSATLAGFEEVLAGCSAAIERLGPQPSRFSSARGYAVGACVSLEHGVRLLVAAVEGLRHGSGNDLVSASGPLGDGQSEMTAAIQALASGSAGP
jgi:hypothetical protein